MRNTVIATTLLFAFLGGRSAIAQGSAKNADAIVLVQPMGKGATIVVTYPTIVSHEVAKQRLARLASAAGWAISSVEVKDEAIQTRALNLGKETSVTVIAQSATIVQDGGFLLQPFVQAFSDLRRIELLFFIQKQPVFNGLRDFDSKTLSVKLVNEGGPYRYSIVVKEPGGALPKLPLTQAIGTGTAATARVHENSSGSRRTSDIALVLMIATGCALVVLVSLLAIARFRMGNSPASGSRRAHRS